MIGIDCTRISRWQNMQVTKLDRFARLLKQNNSEPLTIAKAWACSEAMYKALGYNPNGVISFPKKKPPVFKGEENIVLSLTHEGDFVIAVAINTNQFQQQQSFHQSLN